MSRHNCASYSHNMGRKTLCCHTVTKILAPFLQNLVTVKLKTVKDLKTVLKIVPKIVLNDQKTMKELEWQIVKEIQKELQHQLLKIHSLAHSLKNKSGYADLHAS